MNVALFTLEQLIQSLIIIVVFIFAGFLITQLAQKYLVKWAAKSKTTIDDLLVERIKPPFSYVIWFIGIKVAINPLELHYDALDRILNTVVLAIAVYMVVVVVDVLIKGVLAKMTAHTESTLDDALMPLITKSIHVVVILIGLLWALRIWNIDITPLLASLGVAGLAIGLAVKDSLANIFGGVSMILDQTIKVGDKIKIESGEVGFVHDMGLRSTKMRTLNNEIITLPNGQLANSRVLNYAQPNLEARVVVDFGVGYDSDIEKVRKVVHDALKTIENVSEDPPLEVLFLEMGDSSLNFSARFWVQNYGDVWDKQLEATEKVFAALSQAKIDIPYPTQTIHVKK